MYSKFMFDASRSVSPFDILTFFEYYNYGLKNNIFKNKNKINLKLTSCIDYQNNYIDGDKIEKELFKEIDADVFISHSNKDKELAIAISGWLEKELGLKVFVDFCTWDCIDKIIDELNNRYNIVRTEQNVSKTYEHNKANYFSSHLYLMLNSALNNMLDKTECLLFINTENSIIPLDTMDSPKRSSSPWICSELVMANAMRQSLPSRYTLEKCSMEHNVSQFKNIDFSILSKWKNSISTTEHPLDVLYKITEDI